jgi:cytochrome c553
MRKLLRCSGIGCVGLIILLVLAGLALYPIGLKKLTRTYPNIPVETVSIPVSNSDVIAHGKHLAIIWSCTKCHGDDLSGRLINNSSFSGTIPASNLTSGKGGIATSYTDADWIRAIRHGVKPNGGVEVLMHNYSTLGDQDLGDLIAYLKQLPPVDANLPAIHFGAMLPISTALGFSTPAAETINHQALHPTQPEPGATIEYGQYLSFICTACHQAKNIGVALKDWSQGDFIRAFHTGVLPDGKQLNQAMPLKNFGEMNETELTALWLYFHSLRPASEK